MKFNESILLLGHDAVLNGNKTARWTGEGCVRGK